MAKQEYLPAAESLYIRGNTLEQISLLLPVSVNTLSTWSQKYDWPEKRKKITSQPLAMADQIGECISALVQEMLDSVRSGQGVPPETADAISKLSAVRKAVGGTEDFAAMTIQVTEKLSKFAQSFLKNEDERATFTSVLAAFYQEVTEKNYG